MITSNMWQMFDWVSAGCFSQLARALGHFIWQGCAVAVLYAVAARLLRPAAANTRYIVGVAALLLMAACLPVTLLLIPSAQTAAEAGSRLGAASTSGETFERVGAASERPVAWQPVALSSDAVELNHTSPSFQPVAEDHAAAIVAWVLPCTSVLYLCGVVAMLARVALGLWGGRRLRRDCTPLTQAQTLDMVRDHARRMGMRVVPLIAACRRVSVPVVVGVLRPMILVPASLVSGLTPRELEAVLVHELAHIRRFDPVVNVLQRLVEAMLFFHPGVWWVSRRVSAERENACDDLVLRTNCGRGAYAQALVHMGELCMAGGHRATIESSALAATGKNVSQFRRRVLRVLNPDDKTPIRLTTPGIVISLLLILSLLLAPAAWRGIAWAEDEAEETSAEAPPDQDHQPVSMSAEEFGRLPATEQRALLVRVFQRRLEHAKNLHYEAELFQKCYENHDGEPGKPLNYPPAYPLGFRRHCRYWRLGDSFRKDVDNYDRPQNTEPSIRRSSGIDAEEGLGRSTSIFKDGKRSPQGQVQYPHKPTGSYGYHFWTHSKPSDSQDYNGPWNYLFSDLLEHKDNFEIEVRVEGDKVRLTVPWQVTWAKKPGGKRVYLLDPRKGFLPIRCDARHDRQSQNGQKYWRVKKFIVEESRLVDDVWMPTKLTESSVWSRSPERIVVDKTTVSRIEHGTVTRADIRVPFTEGMKIADTVEGATYTADVQGRPGSDLKLAPNWKHKPPEGWQKGKATATFSMASRLSPADREKLDAEREKERKEKEARWKPIKTALDVLQADPAATWDGRIEAALQILRIYKIGEFEAAWAAAIRELIEIGKPAVPKLIEELDRTERGNMLRALGFVLRGIDDQRAVPALIRAIPRILHAGGGDFGLRIDDDPELAKFMAQYDNESGNGSSDGYFSYGATLREIMPALEKLTGKKLPREDIRFVSLVGGTKQRRIKQEIFLKFAQQWADWWSKNWQRYVKDEGEAQLDRIKQSLDQYAQAISQDSTEESQTGRVMLGVGVNSEAGLVSPIILDEQNFDWWRFPRGPNVTIGEGTHNSLIRSFEESPSNGFLDLDSGRRPRPTEELIKTSAGHKPSKELLAWAEREGVDLITIKIKPPGGDESYYAFQPLGMKVWRIDNSRYDNLQEELRHGKKFELPKPWKGPLAQVDEKSGAYDAKLTTSFLFITKEGICGKLQIKSPLGGNAGYTDGGLHYTFISEGGPEQ